MLIFGRASVTLVLRIQLKREEKYLVFFNDYIYIIIYITVKHMNILRRKPDEHTATEPSRMHMNACTWTHEPLPYMSWFQHHETLTKCPAKGLLWKDMYRARVPCMFSLLFHSLKTILRSVTQQAYVVCVSFHPRLILSFIVCVWSLHSLTGAYLASCACGSYLTTIPATYHIKKGNQRHIL